MKFIGQESILLKNPGAVKIFPEKIDDLYFLHDNLFSPGDTISAATSRKVHDSGTKKKPSRVQLDLEIKINLVYPVEASSSTIRIKGTSTSANSDIKGGASHTLELELNKLFILSKKSWNENAIYALNHPPINTPVLNEKNAAIKLKEFMDILARKSDRVCYGSKNVEAANESSAIETLMITEDLLRSLDFVTRTKYSELVESVREASGDVLVFPAKHENLTKMTGIAAILRFPMAYLDDD